MRQFDWILDVLADLKSFAATNGLPALAEQLDDSMLVAAADIESRNAEARAQAHGDPSRNGPAAGRLGGRQRA